MAIHLDGASLYCYWRFTIFHLLFQREKGFDTGERLQYTEAPLEGTTFFNVKEWQNLLIIKNILDQIQTFVSKPGIEAVRDFDVHQVLYRANREAKTLEIVLIDFEKVKVVASIV